jgi:hypothetical protein
MMRKARPAARVAGIAAGLAVLVAVVGCGGGSDDGVAIPPVPAGLTTAAPDLSGVSLPSFVMPEIKGAVSRPNPHLTPGSVVNTSTQAVCELSSHSGFGIPYISAQKVYAAYGDQKSSKQHKVKLDYLVPLDLGGGTGTSNIWPASLRGTGFYQKAETDHVLHDLVCHRALSLAEAQHAEEVDWYAAWLRYVVATGSA